MNNELLIYAASSLLFLWGIARFQYSRSVAGSLKGKSVDGNLILNMDLAAEGIGISLIGLLSLLITILVGSGKLGSVIIYSLAGTTLVFLSFRSLLFIRSTTGIAGKVCPLVKLVLALFYFGAAYIAYG